MEPNVQGERPQPPDPNLASSSPPTRGVFKRVMTILAYEPVVHGGTTWFIFKNRFVRGAVFLFSCLCTTLVYYGWEDFQLMLYRSGAYRWKCSVEHQATTEFDKHCPAQYDAVQTLYILGVSSEFMIGVLAGIFVDSIGPLLTSFIGNVMFFLGWMCMVYSVQSAQLYIPGMILLAGSVNMIAFPCLELGELFPKRSGLAVSLVVAAQTGGTFVPVALRSVWDLHKSTPFSTIIWGYLLVVFLPCFILSMLCHPLQRFALLRKRAGITKHTEATGVPVAVVVDKLDTAGPTAKSVETDDKQAIAYTGHDADHSNYGSPAVTEPPEEDVASRTLSPTSKDDDTSLTCGDTSGVRASYGPYDIASPHYDQEKRESRLNIMMQSSQNILSQSNVAIAVSMIKERSLWSQVLSTEYVLFTIYYMAQVMQFGYFPTIIQDHFDSGVSTFQGSFLPSQALWGAIFGFVVDYTGTLLICVVLLIMMSLVYVMTLILTTASKYAASVFFIISNAYIYTVKYTYIVDCFPPTHFGFLVGLMGFFGGGSNLFNILIKENDFKAVSVGYLIVGFVGMAIIGFIWYRKKKGLTTFQKTVLVTNGFDQEAGRETLT